MTEPAAPVASDPTPSLAAAPADPNPAEWAQVRGENGDPHGSQSAADTHVDASSMDSGIQIHLLERKSTPAQVPATHRPVWRRGCRTAQRHAVNDVDFLGREGGCGPRCPQVQLTARAESQHARTRSPSPHTGRSHLARAARRRAGFFFASHASFKPLKKPTISAPIILLMVSDSPYSPAPSAPGTRAFSSPPAVPQSGQQHGAPPRHSSNSLLLIQPRAN
jgi:hypothetical protein